MDLGVTLARRMNSGSFCHEPDLRVASRISARYSALDANGADDDATADPPPVTMVPRPFTGFASMCSTISCSASLYVVGWFNRWSMLLTFSGGSSRA